MKKTSTFFAGYFVVLSLTVTQNLSAQCNAAFTYTLGANGTATFASTSTGTTASTQYTWDIPGNPSPNSPTASCTFSDNQVFSITLVIQDLTTNPTCYTGITQTIAVTTMPCNFGLSVSSNTYITGGTMFNHNIPFSGAGYSIFWNFGDGGTSTSLFPYHTYTATGTYIATLTAVSYSGICTYTATTPVVLSTLVPCTYTPAYNYSLGANGTVTLVSISTGTAANTKYKWRIDNWDYIYGNPATYTFQNNGTYPVTLLVLDTLQPLASLCADSVMQKISISNTCIASASFTLQKVSNQNFAWQAMVTYPPNVIAVEWLWGDNTSPSNSLYPSHTYAAAGFYYLCLTVTVSCGSVYSTCSAALITRAIRPEQMVTVNVVEEFTGIQASVHEYRMANLFPNPNDSSFELDLVGFKPFETVMVSIGNTVGEKVYEERFVVEGTSPSKRFSLNELPSGTYFIRITSDSRTSAAKLLINK